MNISAAITISQYGLSKKTEPCVMQNSVSLRRLNDSNISVSIQSGSLLS
ncbi:Uncharacterised protein [Neisseria zoodegmatis]|uniref:Uncharacterized protein n=1 Tax=Neisseria zoodegmatis TaxID=326523 RepID=A0AB38DPJ5_9NEIS|nr:Uncharacterised protein [Neisseria zoodegmatis]